MSLTHLSLSYSSMELLHGCPRKFEFQKILQLGERETSKSSSGGHAMHSAWYEYAVSRSETRALLKLILDYPPEFMQKPGEKWSLQACYSTFKELIEFPIFDEYEIARLQGHPAIEVPFEIELPDYFLDKEKTIPITYVGFIDAILYHRPTQTYKCLDLKNTARWSDNYEAFHYFSSQLVPYGLVLQTVLNEEIDTYEVIYLQNVVDVHEPLVHSFPIQVTIEDRLPSFLVSLQAAINNLQFFYEMETFPRHGSHCVSYSKLCPFYAYCEDDNKSILETFASRGEEHFAKYRDRALKVVLK